MLAFTNEEEESINVAMIGGSLSSLQPLAPGAPPNDAIVRNLTTTRYEVEIPAGTQQELPFVFTTDLHPQDLKLNIIAVLTSKAGVVYQVPVFNQTVSIVEAPTSFFDPQMYAAPI